MGRSVCLPEPIPLESGMEPQSPMEPKSVHVHLHVHVCTCLHTLCNEDQSIAIEWGHNVLRQQCPNFASHRLDGKCQVQPCCGGGAQPMPNLATKVMEI